MSSITPYGILNIVTPDPTGEGGLVINDNFKTISDLISILRPTQTDLGVGIPPGDPTWPPSSWTTDYAVIQLGPLGVVYEQHYPSEAVLLLGINYIVEDGTQIDTSQGSYFIQLNPGGPGLGVNYVAPGGAAYGTQLMQVGPASAVFAVPLVATDVTLSGVSGQYWNRMWLTSNNWIGGVNDSGYSLILSVNVDDTLSQIDTSHGSWFCGLNANIYQDNVQIYRTNPGGSYSSVFYLDPSGNLSITGGPGYFGMSAPAQQTAGGNTSMPSGGSSTPVLVDSTFDGSIGSTAYTIGDLVAALKNYGLLAS